VSCAFTPRYHIVGNAESTLQLQLLEQRLESFKDVLDIKTVQDHCKLGPDAVDVSGLELWQQELVLVYGTPFSPFLIALLMPDWSCFSERRKVSRAHAN